LIAKESLPLAQQEAPQHWSIDPAAKKQTRPLRQHAAIKKWSIDPIKLRTRQLH